MEKIDLLSIGFSDTIEQVAAKFNLPKETINKLIKIGDSPISDKEMFKKVSKLIGKEKAVKYMIWCGTEDFQ